MTNLTHLLLMAVVEAFREIYITWEARLLPTRDPETAGHECPEGGPTFRPESRAQ